MPVDPHHVRRLLDETREEVNRADTKASIVLAGSGVVVGILLTGLVTGDVTLKGDAGIVSVLAWIASVMLVAGVGLVGWAVYPHTKGAEPGRARWFAEIAQYEDETELAEAVQVDQADGGRDLHQTRVLARIVARKYKRTKFGMWLLAIGFGVGALAALLSTRL
jgi:hypothetical protein